MWSASDTGDRMQAEHAHTGPKSSKGASSARLGGARADFVAGLGRKVADIRGTLARVKSSPAEVTVRDELRRKLHALGSAAKMMKFDAMDRGIAEALGTIDRTARDTALEGIDLDAIEQIVEDLPALAWGDSRARSSRAESADRSSAQKYNVLIVGSPHIAEALLDDGSSTVSANFVCESTPDAQAAYDLVRTTEPDLVVLDADLAGSTELVESLMDDPLTETVPLVVVGSFLEPGEAARYVAMGVAKTVGKPTSREALRAVCEETLSPDRGTVTAHAVLGEPTLEELGERLAEEIKEAIVGRADPSARSRRIPLGQGTEILGAVWGAIARVREVVTSRSEGQVRFAGGPEGALTPAPLLHYPEVARADRVRRQKRGPAAEVRLSGRRIVVADDDPGVVWFLADLLKTAGCIVHEAFDGKQALELAYKSAPDLVISDILMPNLDGFSVCRALRRDVALRDTPVILLSWKEDLLQRVRELGAGAAGYVRKESDTRAIIARVREALHVRGRIEARLREDGEVRGRLDGVSIRTLLEIVCATRPEARVAVRDATFLYEIEIRWGAPHRATRTDGEGGFLKGAKVMAQLLGVSAGRFTVTTSTSPVEADLDGNLAAQLAKPIARARAAMALLTGAQMHAVTRIRLDEQGLADYLKATPERARVVARRLANGAAPRELVMCGGCEPALLDDLLCDLASRGLVTAVEGADGEDMLPTAVTGLLQHSDVRASFAPRTGTPSPVPARADAVVIATPVVPACNSDAAVPMCASPTPGPASSLGDAVLREVINQSPEPVHAVLPVATTKPPAVADAPSRGAKSSTPPPAYHVEFGTPPADQMLALADPTVIDDTLYGEGEPSISIAPPPGRSDTESDEDAIIAMENANKNDLTPFASVTSEEEPAGIPAKRKKWPMVAFVAATGVVAWAVVHFSTSSVSLPKEHQQAPAPEMTLPAPTSQAPSTRPKSPEKLTQEQVAAQDKTDKVYYTPVAAETALPAGHGVLDVIAPSDAVVLVDGKERSRGSATLPVTSGNHDVRVRRTPAEERGCTIDVHSSRVAHVKF